MLHLLTWIAIYTGLLLFLGLATQRWRRRRWVKLILLPGTSVAIALQSIASFLCFGSWGRAHPWRDGAPAFEVAEQKIAAVPGGFFLLITHGLLYIGYLYGAGALHERGLIDLHVVSLPDLYPERIIEGRLEIDLRDSLHDPTGWGEVWARHPATAAIFLYVAVSIFASVGVCGRLWRQGTGLVLAIGFIAYIGGWLGAGFRFFGRGWWARLLYFPDWWSEFSLFVVLALATLLLALLARGVPPLVWRLKSALRPPRTGPPRSSNSRRSTASAGARG